MRPHRLRREHGLNALGRLGALEQVDGLDVSGVPIGCADAIGKPQQIRDCIDLDHLDLAAAACGETLRLDQQMCHQPPRDRPIG